MIGFDFSKEPVTLEGALTAFTQGYSFATSQQFAGMVDFALSSRRVDFLNDLSKSIMQSGVILNALVVYVPVSTGKLPGGVVLVANVSKFDYSRRGIEALIQNNSLKGVSSYYVPLRASGKDVLPNEFSFFNALYGPVGCKAVLTFATDSPVLKTNGHSLLCIPRLDVYDKEVVVAVPFLRVVKNELVLDATKTVKDKGIALGICTRLCCEILYAPS
ncbi:hypothetical protein HY486_03530 [Candidatus Woesearchaeota archaeon]|nr:hypothetical protein [Candidatus Woesearchaeota archaeon]